MPAWFLEQLHPLHPGFWLVLSAAAGVIAAVVDGSLRPERATHLRLLRWILVPYLGLITGSLSPRLMGLSDLDWVAGLGLGLALIAGLWVLLILVRITLHWDQLPETAAAPPHPRFPHWMLLIAHAGAQEFHWAFLRGAVWEMLRTMPWALSEPLSTPGYAAIWLASLFALPGLLLHAPHIAERMVGIVILVATAILFFYTRNFWLCWLLHAIAQLVVGQSSRQPNLSGVGSRTQG